MHEMSKLFPKEKKKNVINLSSAELAQKEIMTKLRWFQPNSPKCENISRDVLNKRFWSWRRITQEDFWFVELFFSRQTIKIQLH